MKIDIELKKRSCKTMEKTKYIEICNLFNELLGEWEGALGYINLVNEENDLADERSITEEQRQEVHNYRVRLHRLLSHKQDDET